MEYVCSLPASSQWGPRFFRFENKLCCQARRKRRKKEMAIFLSKKLRITNNVTLIRQTLILNLDSLNWDALNLFLFYWPFLIPTKNFTRLEPRNQVIDVFELHTRRRSTDFEALKLWNVSHLNVENADIWWWRKFDSFGPSLIEGPKLFFSRIIWSSS